jgi:hypothetical protein
VNSENGLPKPNEGDEESRVHVFTPFTGSEEDPLFADEEEA